MVVIAACVGLKDFSAFTQDSAIYWYVDELYSTILFSMNRGTGKYMVKYTLVLFLPRVADGIRMDSILGFRGFSIWCIGYGSDH